MKAAGYYDPKTQLTTLLTTADQQHLDDTKLLALGEAEAVKRGLELTEDVGVVVAEYGEPTAIEW